MFARVDLPPLASVVSVLVVPLLAELADPVAYLGDKADGDRRPRQGDEARRGPDAGLAGGHPSADWSPKCSVTKALSRVCCLASSSMLVPPDVVPLRRGFLTAASITKQGAPGESGRSPLGRSGP
jgi:hypothetical protein